jgi:signal transduction histidine kinase
MRNVLRNIVSNAFKYSEGKPAPEMTVYYTDNTYFIRIKDYGIGIPEQDQPFLFQSFFRASNTGNLPGSGLGLMIAKKLILLHGGNIRCESKADDGCTVTIQCA